MTRLSMGGFGEVVARVALQNCGSGRSGVAPRSQIPEPGGMKDRRKAQ